jgi:hypothetical protein
MVVFPLDLVGAAFFCYLKEPVVLITSDCVHWFILSNMSSSSNNKRKLPPDEDETKVETKDEENKKTTKKPKSNRVTLEIDRKVDIPLSQELLREIYNCVCPGTGKVHPSAQRIQKRLHDREDLPPVETLRLMVIDIFTTLTNMPKKGDPAPDSGSGTKTIQEFVSEWCNIGAEEYEGKVVVMFYTSTDDGEEWSRTELWEKEDYDLCMKHLPEVQVHLPKDNELPTPFDELAQDTVETKEEILKMVIRRGGARFMFDEDVSDELADDISHWKYKEQLAKKKREAARAAMPPPPPPVASSSQS